MNLLYLTGCRLFGPKLKEVNNTYRAAIAGRTAQLGGPGFGVGMEIPIHLPSYIAAHAPGAEWVYISDPWHNFWDPCPTYPDCPPLYSGIDEVAIPVVIESGDSQFYYEETVRHLRARRARAVCIRALSHGWRFKNLEPTPLTDAELARYASFQRPLWPVPPTFYLPHGAYAEMVEASRGQPKVYDVVFSGSDLPDSYPARGRIAKALRSCPEIKTLWIPHPSDQAHDVIGPKFWRKLARARIGVAGTNAYKNLTMRYLEIPACGTMPIGDVPEGEGEADPGWKANLLDIGDLDTDGIVSMLRDWLKFAPVLVAATQAARSFVLSRHTFEMEWHRMVADVERWIRCAS